MIPAAMFGMFQSVWNMTHKETEVTKTLKELRQSVEKMHSPITKEDKENGWRVYYEGKNEGIKEVLDLIDTKLNETPNIQKETEKGSN